MVHQSKSRVNADKHSSLLRNRINCVLAMFVKRVPGFGKCQKCYNDSQKDYVQNTHPW
jgi:hypothetical protein